MTVTSCILFLNDTSRRSIFTYRTVTIWVSRETLKFQLEITKYTTVRASRVSLKMFNMTQRIFHAFFRKLTLVIWHWIIWSFCLMIHSSPGTQRCSIGITIIALQHPPSTSEVPRHISCHWVSTCRQEMCKIWCGTGYHLSGASGIWKLLTIIEKIVFSFPQIWCGKEYFLGLIIT